VQAWAQDLLGLSVSFSRLDARWGLRGPELSFYDASVARPDQEAEPMISAGEVTLGLSPMVLFFERRLAVSRLELERTELTLERGVDGQLRLQGAPSEQQSRRYGISATFASGSSGVRTVFCSRRAARPPLSLAAVSMSPSMGRSNLKRMRRPPIG
jgi:uncharacterized protein involved in outer membrane biogenesis